MPPVRRKKLISLPVQLISAPEGILVKRGSTEFLVKGSDAAKAIRLVLNATRGAGASSHQIKKLFNRNDADRVDRLIKSLTDRRLLIPYDTNATSKGKGETNLDVFLWDIGESTRYAKGRLNTIRLSIVGVNYISRQLSLSLTASGYLNHVILDQPQHRNRYFFTKAGHLVPDQWPTSVHQRTVDNCDDFGDCLIATSDFGSQQSLCEWNRICLEKKVPFLPVILKNLVGYVGPLVISGETPCFECFMARQRSHSIDVQLEHLIDELAFEGQKTIGFHPSMAMSLGDIAAFEVCRFFSDTCAKREPGQIMEVDLLGGRAISRTVLKVPRCAACSPLHRSSVTNIKKVLFPEDRQSF